MCVSCSHSNRLVSLLFFRYFLFCYPFCTSLFPAENFPLHKLYSFTTIRVSYMFRSLQNFYEVHSNINLFINWVFRYAFGCVLAYRRMLFHFTLWFHWKLFRTYRYEKFLNSFHTNVIQTLLEELLNEFAMAAQHTSKWLQFEQQ